jgi:hypothetical protein
MAGAATPLPTTMLKLKNGLIECLGITRLVDGSTITWPTMADVEVTMIIGGLSNDQLQDTDQLTNRS